MNSELYTVIGVLAPDFWQPLPSDLYVPWPLAQLRAKDRVDHDFGVIARLKPSVTLAQAQAELSAIARRIDAETPRLAGWDVTVVGMKQALFEYIRPALLLLLGAVGLLLLLTCVNVASLLLARVTGRRKEMAIRAALGARRGRLIVQILSESLLLSLMGGALGVFFAVWGVDLLSAVLPSTLPMAEAGAEIMRPAIGVDARALAFALLISTGAALIFGLIPALYVAGADVNDALKAGGRTSSPSPGRTGVWSLLVAGEVALATMLLIGAGLAMKSFVNLQQVNPGIRPDHVLTFRMRLPTDNLYKSNREQIDFYRRVLDNVERIPGIQSAGLTDVLPLGQQNDREYFTIENRPLPPGQSLVADFRRISPRYLNTMGIALLEGRLLSDRDVRDAPPVILIDETLARQYWPTENPIGRRMRLWGEFREVVGIVSQVHHYGLEKQPEPTIYAPYAQMPDKAMALTVRTTMETQGVVKAVKQAVWLVDPGQPVFQIRSMDEYISLANTAPRISTILLAVFAGISMLLAALGIHGVVSYGVAQRTREFGLRMALGSTPGQLQGLVIGNGIKTALIGLLAGMAGAAGLASVLHSLLYGVTPLDPAVMAGVAALLLTVAFIANYVPARRATRIDPMDALHHE
jgi:putative ABC transport system permease protein